jgi:hypothetical protein
MNGSQSALWYQTLDGKNPPRHVANVGDDEISYFVLAPDDNTFAFIRGKWIYQAVLIEGVQ